MVGRLLAFLVGLFLICATWFGSEFFRPSICNDSRIVKNLSILAPLGVPHGFQRVESCGDSKLSLENWTTHQDLKRFLDRIRKIETLAELYSLPLTSLKNFEIKLDANGAFVESDYLIMKRFLREMVQGKKIVGIQEDFTFELESHLILTILYGSGFVPHELNHNYAGLTHTEVCQSEWLPQSYSMICKLEALKKVEGFSKYSGWGLLPETFNYINGSYLDFNLLQRSVMASHFLPKYFNGKSFLNIDAPLASYARLSDLIEHKVKLLEKLKSQFHDIRI